MWRSSWSGPRGYSSWSTYPSGGLSYANVITTYWYLGCNNGKGYYDYYPVVEGYATNIGTGPKVRSDNQLNHQDCGTSAP